MVKKIAIIPARGGSTRVPYKNIINFNGKPMIAYTINAARESGLFEHIIVSTDDETIAEVSKQWGAEVPFLRTQYADHHSTVSLATLFALNQAEEYYKEKYDIVVQLMANCPIRDSRDIQISVDNFMRKRSEAQISCFKFGFSNPWWAFTLDEDGRGTNIIKVDTNKRSQDLKTLFCPTGAIWISTSKHLREYKSFYGNHRYFEIDWKHAVDIDNYDDVEMANVVFNMINRD